MGEQLDEKIERVCAAFTKFRKQKKWKWEDFQDMFSDTGKKYSFGTSPTSMEGYFGIGGKRSPINDGSIRQHKDYLIQVDVIKALNEFIIPRIKVAGNEVILNDDGNFAFEEMSADEQATSKLEEVFTLYYWRHGDSLGKCLLQLNSHTRTATLTIEYPDKNMVLTGRYTNIKDAYCLRLVDSENDRISPRTQINFLKPRSPIKFCYYATFSTARRSKLQAVSGTMLLFRKEFEDQFPVTDFAHYALYMQRYEMAENGLDFPTSGRNVGKEISVLNTFLILTKYAGIYECAFINTKRQTYETAILVIKPNLEIAFLLKRRLTSKPYEGVAKLYSDNKNLIVYYDYEKEINDFRMRLTFDVGDYKVGSSSQIFGMMTGFDLDHKEIMASSMVIKKLETADIDLAKDFDIAQFHDKVGAYELNTAEGFKKFKAHVKTNKTTDFFYGSKLSSFTSVGYLNNLK